MLNKSSYEFLQDLASSLPAPGGGGASALCGALGAALGSMVGNLTYGKKKYADVQQDIEKLLKELESSRMRMEGLVQADADAFLPLSKAYGMPKETEEEKAQKALVMEEALRQACKVPMDILKECVTVAGLLEKMGKIGTKLAISDVAVGAAFIRAAAQGAAVNVYTNTRLMQDKEYAAHCERSADQMRLEVTERADSLYLQIEGELR